jgi:large subunit ribosomal protein L22
MSAKKVRLIADSIRGINVAAALERLSLIPRLASKPVAKTVQSALANAQHNFQKKKELLIVGAITVDEAPPLKRWRPRAFGRAAGIRKHGCHITVVLQEVEIKKPESEKKEKAVGSNKKKKK